MTSYELGKRYEKQVLRWLLEEYRQYRPQGETNTFARGLAAIQPYEVDISVTIDNGGIPRQVRRFWVECRWRDQGTIKRDDVEHFVYKGQDSVRYARKIGVWHYDGLMFVSNRPFHADALNVAKHEKVACVTFNGRSVVQDLKVDDWLSRPRWLAHC